MNRKKYTPYIYAGVTAVLVLAAAMLMVFVIFQRKELSSGIKAIIKILEPFVIGGLLAYLLAPLCNRFERLMQKILPDKPFTEKLSRVVSVFLSSIFALAILAVLIGLIVPSTLKSLISLIMSLPDYVMKLIDWSGDKLSDYPELKKYMLNLVDVVYDKLDTWTQSQLMPSIQTFINGVGSGITQFISLMLNVIIGFIVAVYLLNSRKIFARQGKMVIYALFRPRTADLIFDEIKFADKMFSGFLRGKVLDSAIVGMICFIAMTIMEVQDAMLISVIVGITNIIPFFGPFIGAIPSALLILVTDPKKCVYFIIFIIILQQVDGNILGPKCMGSNVNLSAFWVLFAILLFGGLFGFVGMIIGVPLFAVIYDIFKKIIYNKLKRHGKSDLTIQSDPPDQEDTTDEHSEESDTVSQNVSEKTAEEK